MLEFRSFDVCKNTVVIIIVMLNCSEINIKISDTSMKTTDSDDYREILGDDEHTNGVLAMTQERVRFSCKDG